MIDIAVSTTIMRLQQFSGDCEASIYVDRSNADTQVGWGRIESELNFEYPKALRDLYAKLGFGYNWFYKIQINNAERVVGGLTLYDLSGFIEDSIEWENRWRAEDSNAPLSELEQRDSSLLQSLRPLWPESGKRADFLIDTQGYVYLFNHEAFGLGREPVASSFGIDLEEFMRRWAKFGLQIPKNWGWYDIADSGGIWSAEHFERRFVIDQS